MVDGMMVDGIDLGGWMAAAALVALAAVLGAWAGRCGPRLGWSLRG